MAPAFDVRFLQFVCALCANLSNCGRSGIDSGTRTELLQAITDVENWFTSNERQTYDGMLLVTSEPDAAASRSVANAATALACSIVAAAALMMA